MKIIGTGLSGLVGSRIVEILSQEHEFTNLSLDTGVDITDKDIVSGKIRESDAPWVFHFAAKTDVDGCEKDKASGREGDTWKINVSATEYIVEVCTVSKKRLLYISTDFVFDGTKDFYTENDTPHPLSWYAKTKYEGEKRVGALGDHSLIIRISFPYRAKFTGKTDFVAGIRNKLIDGQNIMTPGDQIIVPTFIDDIARAIHTLISSSASGIYHVTGSQALSPFDAGIKIARIFGLDGSLIGKTTFADYYKNRAPRPFHAVLKNDKIQKFGIKMSTFDEGLDTIKHQT